jgi:hypothetical protein
MTFDFSGFKSVTLDAEVEDKDKETAAAVPVYTSIKFTFTMDSLIVDLFTGGSKEVCAHSFYVFVFLSCTFSHLVIPFSFLLFSFTKGSISHFTFDHWVVQKGT